MPTCVVYLKMEHKQCVWKPVVVGVYGRVSSERSIRNDQGFLFNSEALLWSPSLKIMSVLQWNYTLHTSCLCCKQVCANFACLSGASHCTVDCIYREQGNDWGELRHTRWERDEMEDIYPRYFYVLIGKHNNFRLRSQMTNWNTNNQNWNTRYTRMTLVLHQSNPVKISPKGFPSQWKLPIAVFSQIQTFFMFQSRRTLNLFIIGIRKIYWCVGLEIGC